MHWGLSEWAVVVEALGRGEQILVLRPCGYRERRAEPRLEHPRFFLVSQGKTAEQLKWVDPAARARLEVSSGTAAPRDRAHLELFAEVRAWRHLSSFADARVLRGQHLFNDDGIKQRFDWARGKGLLALAVRVFRLPEPAELPPDLSASRRKTWVELPREVAAPRSRPVLARANWLVKLKAFETAIGHGTGVPAQAASPGTLRPPRLEPGR